MTMMTVTLASLSLASIALRFSMAFLAALLSGMAWGWFRLTDLHDDRFNFDVWWLIFDDRIAWLWSWLMDNKWWRLNNDWLRFN
jgi:hypothetical protein